MLVMFIRKFPVRIDKKERTAHVNWHPTHDFFEFRMTGHQMLPLGLGLLD
jgi:hypothetical protein